MRNGAVQRTVTSMFWRCQKKMTDQTICQKANLVQAVQTDRDTSSHHRRRHLGLTLTHLKVRVCIVNYVWLFHRPKHPTITCLWPFTFVIGVYMGSPKKKKFYEVTWKIKLYVPLAMNIKHLLYSILFFYRSISLVSFLNMANAIPQFETVSMRKALEEQRGPVLVRLYQPHDTGRENLTYMMLCKVYYPGHRHYRQNPENNRETSMKISLRAVSRIVHFCNIVYQQRRPFCEKVSSTIFVKFTRHTMFNERRHLPQENLWTLAFIKTFYEVDELTNDPPSMYFFP